MCGNEVVNLASATAYAHTGTESNTNAQIPLATYSAWFTLDVSATNAVTECGVNTYELFASDGTTAVAATVAYIDSTSKDLVIVQSTAASLTTYKMKATTLGSKTQEKEFTIQIDAAINCASALSNS